VLIIAIGLAITATALLPLSHALTDGLRPHVPTDWLALPTRRALRSRPVHAIGVGE
jgi:hypothetical protein